MSTERAFETESIIIRDRTGLVAFDIDPTTVGFNAPVGSLGMRTNGLHYRKTGALDTDWTETDTGAATSQDIHAGVDTVISGDDFTIQERKQSIIHGLFTVEGTGNITIEGTLVVLGEAIYG